MALHPKNEIKVDACISTGGPPDLASTSTNRSNFLNAIFAYTDDAIRALLGDDIITDPSPELLSDPASDPLVYPVTASGAVAWLFRVREDVKAQGWREDPMQPNAVLYKDGKIIAVYSLRDQATVDEAARAANALGMLAVDEPIPLPGVDGWKLAHHDPDVSTTISILAGAHRGMKYAVGDRYGDAIVETPFDEADHADEVMLTFGANKESKKWTSKKMPRLLGLKQFLTHKEGGKDGPGAVLGDMVEGERRKTGVKKLYFVGLDDDTGTPIEENKEKIRASGYAGVLYTTHSNGKTESDIVRDRIIKFAPDEDIDIDLIKRFMLEVEKKHPALVDLISGFLEKHNKNGPIIVVQHAPISKMRFIGVLETPFDVASVGKTHAEGMKMWAKVPEGFANKIGMTLDESCTDTARIFYPPRHARCAPFGIWLYGGKCVDATEFIGGDPIDDFVKQTNKSKSKSVTPEGKALGKWSMKRAHGFQIADVINDLCPEKIRGTATRGYDIECPYDSSHSNSGDPDDRACFVVNAAEGGQSEFFTISCRHEGCRQYTFLDMLGKMLADGWFDKEVLEDEAYNAILEDDVEPEVSKDETAPGDDPKQSVPPKLKAYEKSIAELTPDSSEAERMRIYEMIDKAQVAGGTRKKLLRKINKNTGINDLKEVKREYKDATGGNPSGDSEVEYVDGMTYMRYFGSYHFDVAEKAVRDVLIKENIDQGRPVFSALDGNATRMHTNKDTGRITFEELTTETMWGEVNSRLRFIRSGDEGDGTRDKVKEDVTKSVFLTAYTFLPPTPEVVYTPVYVESGDVITEPGYYGPPLVGSSPKPGNPTADLNLILANTGFQIDPVDPDPSFDVMQAALNWVKTEILDGFCFSDKGQDEDEAERREPSEANALSMLLTPFVRRMINGRTPVFFVTKPQPGTGGTLLGRIPMILFDGSERPPVRYSHNDEEMNKGLNACLMEARSHLFFDDVKDFNNRELLRAITSSHVGSRILGGNKNFSARNTFGWIGTGNNPNVGSEMERRIVWIRLNAKTDNIQKRKFRHDDLDKWLLDNRATAVHHLLTLIQYWISTGKVPFTERKRASFEDWSAKVGGVLQACGVQGFLDNKRDPGQDPDETAIKSFMREWLKFYGMGVLITPKKAFEWALNAGMEIIEGLGEDQKKVRFHSKLPTLNGRTFSIGDHSYMFQSGIDGEDDLAYQMIQLPPEVVVPEVEVLADA